MNPSTLNNKGLLERSLKRLQRLCHLDPQLRQSQPLPSAMDHLKLESHSTAGTMTLAFDLYAQRPALGSRDYKIARDRKGRHYAAYLPHFRTITYADLGVRVAHLASGLASESIAQTGDSLGLLGFGSLDYMVAALACNYRGITFVPLPTNATPEELAHMVQEAELKGLMCSLDSLPLMERILASCEKVGSVVVFDVIEADDQHAAQLKAHRDQFAAVGRHLHFNTMTDVEILGRENGPIPPYIPPKGTDTLMTLIYTSGSTGTPKGAMFPESIWVQNWQQALHSHFPILPLISINFMPLNHIAGLLNVIRGLMQGGVTYFTLKSDMSTLFEDIRLVRPTVLFLVPRISSMIYQEYQIEVMRRVGREASPATIAKVSEEVMMDMRHVFLGDRLLFATTGTAPTSPVILDFLRLCFDIPVFNSYGQTEVGMVTFEDQIAREYIEDYKLVDVPELNYLTSDKPHPRGELRIKTKRTIPGYLKNAAASQDLLDTDGFVKTGDIVEEIAKDHVVWIDRTKNILKLSQGEFVTLWRLESLYAGAGPLIQQIFLYGNSERPYLLAIVVPYHELILQGMPAAKNDAAPQTLDVKRLMKQEINRVAKQEQLRPYEIPRDIIIEETPFSRENGLLTESNKLSRARLKEKYGARLEALYQEIERNQIQVLSDLVTTDVETSTGDKVLRALKSTLGTEDIVTAQATSFRDLGGDSINAVEFHQLVDKICHVNLPVGFILNPSSTVRDYVAYVEEAISASPESRPVTFAAIHGNNAIDVSQDDLRLDKFLNTPDKKFAYACQGQATVTDSQVVFLTGANGFLGRFLTLEALKQLPRERGKLYCMVRAPHDEAARDRLFGEFEQGDLSMHKHFRDLAAEGRLEVVAGDLMRPRFGMSQEIYGRLAREADTIIHNGALVNHALSYAQLFEPNVLGSVEVIRLALRQRRKAISYVSSVAVVGKVADDHIIREQESAHSLWYRRPVNSGYGVGYGTSKWASEILLEEAYERYQLPMNVFRCGMILAHREFEGQVNVPDFFTRLILSLIYTGMAPQSFYATPAIQTRHPHFDGLPVDFMARSIIGIALHPRHEFATYHVVNDHWDDGISLDTVVDWIIAAGYPIKRVADYGTWYEKFRDRLQRLEASRRQHSSFPIVYQWENPIDLAHETRLDASRYRARVRQLDDDDNHMPHDIPHVNEDLIHKYIADLQELDLIEEPEGSAMVRSPHGERRPRGEDTSREVSS